MLMVNMSFLFDFLNGKVKIMELFLAFLLFAVGLALIVKGGDFFVDAASWIAEVSGIPKLIVGATIVSVATTLPELLVSSFAAASGDPAGIDTAIGNAVGSVTANIGLIMAISLIAIPTAIKRRDYALKSLLMLGAGVVILVSGIVFKGVGVIASIILLLVLAISIFENVRAAKRAMAESTDDERPVVNKKTIIINIIKFVVGVAGIVIGAQLMVDNATVIATKLGVSERIIGLTIVAIGTSLPEFVTTITAIVKKQSSLSVGNIIGANIIDLAMILPACALVSGGTLPIPSTFYVDVAVCIGVGALALIPTLITKRFHRWQGIVLLVTYLTYVALMCAGAF